MANCMSRIQKESYLFLTFIAGVILGANLWGMQESWLENRSKPTTTDLMDLAKENQSSFVGDGALTRVGYVPHDDPLALLHPVKLAERLELLHVPKTGGTALEIAAARAGVSWSFCHFHPKFIRSYIDFETGSESLPLCKTTPQLNKGMTGYFNFYHTPACFFKESFYNGAAVFAVVRNPYDRMLSSFSHHARVQKINQTTTNLNRWLHENLKVLSLSPLWRAKAMCTKDMNDEYFRLGCHLVPQYDYIFGSATTFADRVVHHIVKYENLHQSFDKLMKVYGLHIALPEKPQKKDSKRKTRSPLRKPSSLTRENVELIRTIYRDDFLAFGYKMEIE